MKIMVRMLSEDEILIAHHGRDKEIRIAKHAQKKHGMLFSVLMMACFIYASYFGAQNRER